VISATGAVDRADDGGGTLGGVPEPLTSYFHSPPEFAGDFGAYKSKSPLVFDDGRPVRDAADWQGRRREIIPPVPPSRLHLRPSLARPKAGRASRAQSQRSSQRHASSCIAALNSWGASYSRPRNRSSSPALA
jgi:hypothetical protein